MVKLHKYTLKLHKYTAIYLLMIYDLLLFFMIQEVKRGGKKGGSAGGKIDLPLRETGVILKKNHRHTHR